jgi:hypothetical protein
MMFRAANDVQRLITNAAVALLLLLMSLPQEHGTL